MYLLAWIRYALVYPLLKNNIISPIIVYEWINKIGLQGGIEQNWLPPSRVYGSFAPTRENRSPHAYAHDKCYHGSDLAGILFRTLRNATYAAIQHYLFNFDSSNYDYPSAQLLSLVLHQFIQYPFNRKPDYTLATHVSAWASTDNGNTRLEIHLLRVLPPCITG